MATINQGAFAGGTWSMVLAYDPATGTVLHMHQCLTQAGGQHPDDKGLEAQAAEQIARRSRPLAVAQPAFLHVEPDTVKPGTIYKVDLAKRALVEIPSPR